MAIYRRKGSQDFRQRPRHYHRRQWRAARLPARPVDGGYMIRGKWAYGSAISTPMDRSHGLLPDRSVRQGHGDQAERPAEDRHHASSAREHQAARELGRAGAARPAASTTPWPRVRNCSCPWNALYHFDVEAPLRGSAQGALGLAGYSAWGHTSLGDRCRPRMLDELVKVIVQRRDPFGLSAEEAPSFKVQFAQNEAKFRAAHALAYKTWRDCRRLARTASRRRSTR